MISLRLQFGLRGRSWRGSNHSGTAYAADGLPAGSTHTYRLPEPSSGVGFFYGSNADVTLTLFGTDGELIGSNVFGAQATPLLETNFVGLTSTTAIGSFSLASADLYVYDDVLFQPIPEPAAALLVTGLVGMAGWLRKICGSN